MGGGGMNLIEEKYGELLEGMHITGYTFERGCTNLIWMLQEKRWKRCGNGFSDVNEFLASLRMDNFIAVAEQRKKIAAMIKTLQPKASNRAIAKALNVSGRTIDRDMDATNVAVKSKKPNKNNGSNATNVALSGGAAARLVGNREARKERDQQASEERAGQIITGEGKVRIIAGDFRAADLKNIDAIITDPPYGKEFLPLLRDLAAWANKVLKPDGIMAVLYGQTYLPEAFSMMSGFRPYRWTACYLTPGNAYASHARAVVSNWKPLLVYGGNEPRFADLFESAGDEEGKQRHDWGQDFEAFHTIVERLTLPGQLIVDPFAGGGTTLFAAKTLGRDSIGCEIDPEHVKTIQSILSKESKSVAA
jgi:16S rRNA G966 N2-methylase RsmD